MAQKASDEIAEKYNEDFCDHVLEIVADTSMLEHTKTTLLDMLAFKIACASITMKTGIDPHRLTDYRLLMLPSHQVDKVTKYLAENFNNTLAKTRGHHG